MNRIKAVLKDINLSWLANKLGKSYNMADGYMQNKQQPHLEVLNNIAEILDVDIKQLITSIKKRINLTIGQRITKCSNEQR
ncbi:helix-turn-helix domain-containing protein [Polaribacter sp.]|uniref:helix-turn-helix domain-containing protein n=1 Tax=Polaribacter sp. TaxID=1920175 RepID=UPI003F697247